MFLEYFHIATAGLALFLFGANAAFLLHIKQPLLGWFQFKILAIMLLLVYISLSVIVGNVGISRSVLAAIALIVDAVALYRVYMNVDAVKSGKITREK